MQTLKNIFSNKTQVLPNLGVGMSLKSSQLHQVNNHWPQVAWYEIISEEFMNPRTTHRKMLKEIAESHAITMHGVSLSIGSIGPLNIDYLSRLKALADDVQPAWLSDHLCWTGVLGQGGTHELLPVMLNERMLKHIIKRIKIVQDFLERPLILENPSASITDRHSTIAEWDFLRYLTEETGCGLLLDVDNVWKSCSYKDINPHDYINGLPHDHIVQVHISHDESFAHEYESLEFIQAWDLLEIIWEKTGGVSTLLEWENDGLCFDQCLEEYDALKEDVNTMERLWLSPVLAEEEFEAIKKSVRQLVKERLIKR